MKKLETKIEKAQRERDELVSQVGMAEKGANLLKNPDSIVFVELIAAWIKHFENRLNNFNPLDEHFQVEYSSSKETKDFLSARLDALRDADDNLLRLQVALRESEIELKKQVKIVKNAEQSRF